MFNVYGMVRHLALGATLIAATAAAAPQADLSVDLRARDGILFTSIQYDVSITNRGPNPLTSATVTVQLDSHAALITGVQQKCVLNTAAHTMACTFGSLAVGATAKLSPWVIFGDSLPPGPVAATATRTASAPVDPNAANDSDSATCTYVPTNQPLDPPPEMYC